MKEPENYDTTGFAPHLQKLHCLIVLNDELAPYLSNKAGDAFFRAFITEERATGDVMCKFRFRYKDGDQWYHHTLQDRQQLLSLKEKVEYLANGIDDKMLRVTLQVLSKSHMEPPKDAVLRYYPPNPDDGKETLDWLVAQNLLHVTHTWDKDGIEGQS
jgi:hypothetical protein